MIARALLILIPGALPLLAGMAWFGFLLLNAAILATAFAPAGVAWIVYGAAVTVNALGLKVALKAG